MPRNFVYTSVICKTSASLGCDNDEWWVGADVVSAEDEAEIPEENVFEEDLFIKDEFEGRELSVVLEETEAEETCSEYESSNVDEVHDYFVVVVFIY